MQPSDLLVDYGAPTGGGAVLFSTASVVIAAIWRDLRDIDNVTYGEWAAYGGALGGVLGFCLKLFGA